MMQNTEMKSVIQMKTFGCFELIYGDKSLLKGKTKESQFTLLMQFILHEGQKGVTREHLEEVLFDKREIEDKHHALRSVIYNAKKKLTSMGLPGINYIYSQDGFFFWNNEIEIREDALEFEKMYEEAFAETDVKKRIEKLCRTCRMYTDEFLSDYCMIPWVAEESKRYREMFGNCVEECTRLLKGEREYRKLAELGKQAARHTKYAGYEMLVMDALIEMENYQEAGAYYDEVEKEYMESDRYVPLAVYNNYMEQLAEKISHPVEQLSNIRKNIDVVNIETTKCFTYPVFKGIYQILRLTAQRSSVRSCLLLCALSDLSGNPLREQVLHVMDQNLENGINTSIRKGDVVTRYGPGQYLVLLIAATKRDCQNIQRRIDTKVGYKNKYTKVTYLFEEILPYEEGCAQKFM